MSGSSRARHGAHAEIAGATVLFAVAATTVRLLVTGEYLSYVRPAMAPFLVASALFLTVLAGWSLRAVWSRRGPDVNPDGHAAHLPRTSWLLLCPVLVVVVVAPQSLGALTATRNTPAPLPPSAAGFTALPAGDPLGLPLQAYVERASYGGAATLHGRRFAVPGFVSPTPDPGGWYLTQLMIRCCAADALPLQIRMVGAAPPPRDDWVIVTGTYLPTGPGEIPQLRVESIEPTPRPRHPYVYG